MNFKLLKISTKSFVIIFSIINVIAGVILGGIVTVVSLLNPDGQGGAIGTWAVILFPVFNGLLGLVSGALLTALFNFIAPRFGGLQMEFEEKPNA